MMRSFLSLAIPFLLLGCPPLPPTNDVPPADTVAPSSPDPPVAPGVVPEEAACKRLEELQCKSRDGRDLWAPTPGGVSCADVFKNAKTNGVDLHPACIANMTSCDERDACTNKP
jgi:hypothetical protein